MSLYQHQHCSLLRYWKVLLKTSDLHYNRDPLRGWRSLMNDFIYGIFVPGPTGVINSVYPVHLSFTLLIHYHHHKYVQICYPVPKLAIC